MNSDWREFRTTLATLRLESSNGEIRMLMTKQDKGLFPGLLFGQAG